MIFIDETKVDLDPKKLKELQEVFPKFFREKNPKGVTISYIPTSILRLRDGKGNIVEQWQQSKPITAKAWENTGTGRHLVRYSPTFPRVGKSGELIFARSIIDVSHRMTIAPKRDLDLLYFMWFYSKCFTNNAAQPRGVKPFLSFEMPLDRAQKTVMSKLEHARVTTMIIDPEMGGISDMDIIDVARAMFLSEVDDKFEADKKGNIITTVELRNELLSIVESDPQKARIFFQLIKKDENFEVRKLISEAMAKDVIRWHEQSSTWHHVRADGVLGRKIIPVLNKDEKHNALANVIRSDESLRSTIKDKLSGKHVDIDS